MSNPLVALVTAVLLCGSALTGSVAARDRADRREPSASQIVDQFAARTARIKASLRLTAEQEKNWGGFETAMNEYGKTSADRRIAGRTARAEQTASDRADEIGAFNVITQMRMEAKYMAERSVDRKAIADAAEPLYASLDNQQKKYFAQELLRLNRWPELD